MLSGFDKTCAVVAFGVGVVLLLLGAFGLVTGCYVHVTLPPLLGVLPAFAGWGVVRSVYVAWSSKSNRPSALVTPSGHINDDLRCARCGYNLRKLHSGGHCPECGEAIHHSASAFVPVKQTNPYATTREDIEHASPPLPEEPIDDELDRRFRREQH